MDASNHTTVAKNEEGHLLRCLSPLNVWALSFGCAVGWGAFVMPGTTFLPIAGPAGTALGMLIGGAIMLIIGVNYHYMMRRYPDAGGTFTYTKKTFGYDHGFLSAWFLVLVYIAITWANATALPLVFRNLFSGVFQVGFHYQIAGYDVYFGEVILSLAALELSGLACMRGGRFAARIQTIMACVLFGGILIGGGAVAVRHFGCFLQGSLTHFKPAFAPGHNPAAEVFNIVALAPWAFVGFESVSHSAEEFNFSPKKSFSILVLAVITGVLAYAVLSALAVSVLPAGYSHWDAYIADIGKFSGLKGLPTFHAVRELMGGTGLMILFFTILAAVITGLVGNSIAASRLIYSMARDNLLPEWFAKLNKNKAPENAILFVMAISIPIPFFGRTAIGWIVDVNTIGATVAYAYTSAVAYKVAKDNGNLAVQFTGMIGMVTSLLFFLYFLVPNFWTVSALTTESYLILVAWSVAGFVFFRYIFQRDTEQRFGKSTIVWLTLLFLILFISTLWVREAMQDTMRTVLNNLSDYNYQELGEHGISLSPTEQKDTAFYIQSQMNSVSNSLLRNSVAQMALIAVSLYIMFHLYTLMQKREKDMEVQKIEAEQSSRAKSTFLSNMSHDIRTPMNAIIGYVTLSKKEPDIPPKVSDYLTKIEASGGHLLSLINDVLEMSRIESGKMELEPAKADLVKTLGEVRDLFATQMETKGLTYTVDTSGVIHKMVLCDAPRLNRVLLNLISNAFKFTPAGGRVTVTLTETGATEGAETITGTGYGDYELRVKDSGMGMSPEFAEHVFEAYERERRASNIQGTGLGMAITKTIVDLMGGDIRVETQQGVGTEFIINVQFPLAAEDEADQADAESAASMDFTGVRLLLAEDNAINREIATLLLEEAGFVLDTAENGKIAVEKVAASRPGDYQCVLMDIQMPVMDGYEAAQAIRRLKNKELARIPIVAMTANAFSEDIQAAKDAGMNSHISKPIDVHKMMETLAEVLRNPTPPPPKKTDEKGNELRV
ncbi:MAG: amino acid permease [Oscillibacter sp.]|nr:amino acid permease [Oscillibacter sp.]